MLDQKLLQMGAKLINALGDVYARSSTRTLMESIFLTPPRRVFRNF